MLLLLTSPFLKLSSSCYAFIFSEMTSCNDTLFQSSPVQWLFSEYFIPRCYPAMIHVQKDV